MIKYNSDNIIVGYIKQLLHDCNLPKATVAVNGIAIFPGQAYLYQNNVVRVHSDVTPRVFDGRFDKSEIDVIYRYDEKLARLNCVSNLSIKGIEYDSATHEFLGDYLRFIRDYKKLDLMSMYNCFSEHMPKVNLTIDGHTFDSTDSNYKIYSIPVKLFQKYTIKVSSVFPVEVACVFEGKNIYNVNNISEPLFQKTYEKFDASQIHTYTKIFDLTVNEINNLNVDNQLMSHLADLRLLVKINSGAKSGAVILEGEYANCNDRTLTDGINYNHTVTNFDSDEGLSDKFIGKLQLLEFDSGEAYPFADRLYEYLVDNAITHLDKTSGNVKRIQDRLVALGKLEQWEVDTCYGIWQPIYRNMLYELALVKKLDITTNDILGYCDKDVEIQLGE